MLGEADNHYLNGGAGDDRLYGSFGRDVLTGGQGRDLFGMEEVGRGFRDGSKPVKDVLVTDFVHGEDALDDETISFDRYDFNGDGQIKGSDAYVTLQQVAYNGDTKLSLVITCGRRTRPWPAASSLCSACLAWMPPTSPGAACQKPEDRGGRAAGLRGVPRPWTLGMRP
ncbi:calcium-binding protein [Geminicoccus flavidas]|uniref:hypothetical protein n=1 Tax=Geminicoccus flavidas TaxID=2506407 RepID=UPI00135AEBE2|nr:hypothetical protein [Geminicoccus flavidas]